MHLDQIIAPITRAQMGLITRSQARSCGITDAQITRCCRDRRWVPIRRNVYAVTTAPPSAEQMLLAAALAVEGAVASHSTAARLWRIGDDLGPDDDPVVELTALRQHGIRQRGLLVHRTSVLPASHVTCRDGVPVTSFARTLVDLSARLPATQLKEMADEGVRRGQLVVARLRSTVGALEKAPGRRPTVVHEVLAQYDDGVDEMTDSAREAWLLRLLRQAGFDPVPQFRVVLDGRTYLLDLALVPFMVALEYDGWGTHRTEASFHADRDRRRRLIAAGWLLIEVTRRTDPDALIADLRRIVHRRATG